MPQSAVGPLFSIPLHHHHYQPPKRPSRPTSASTNADSPTAAEEPGPLPPRKRPKLSSNIARTQCLSAHALPPPAPHGWATQKKTHLANVTAILHVALLNGDLGRATRAFGLLLRTGDVDVRLMWRIGVELLVRGAEGRGEEGGAAVRRYLDILSTRFQHRMMNYFPSGFGGWKGRPVDRSGKVLGAGGGRTSDAEVGREKRKRTELATSRDFLIEGFIAQIKVAATPVDGEEGNRGDIQDARTVLERLEDAMLTPPWSDDARLWFLRGMLGLYVSDASRSQVQLSAIPAEDRREWERELSVASSQVSASQAAGWSEEEQRWRAWRRGLEQVRKCFEEVESRGEEVGEDGWKGLKALEEWARGEEGEDDSGEWAGGNGDGEETREEDESRDDTRDYGNGDAVHRQEEEVVEEDESHLYEDEIDISLAQHL